MSSHASLSGRARSGFCTRQGALAWAALGVLAACVGNPSSSGEPQKTANPSVSASTYRAAAVPGSASGAAAPTAAPSDVAALLTRFFASYVDGTDFAFLRDACRPRLARFGALEDADVDDVVRSARSFFRGKRHLSYEPRMAALRVERGPSGEIAHLPVRMYWTYEPPLSWTTPGDAGWNSWGNALPEVDRIVTVEIDIVLDENGKIVSYLEAPAHMPLLRVTGQDGCDLRAYATPHDPLSMDHGVPVVRRLARGAVVRDLGETFDVSWCAKGPETVRKVRVGDHDAWMDTAVSFAVPNPYGGTSAGGSTCLEPIHPTD